MIDGAERSGDLLALEALEVAGGDAGVLAGDDRHGGVGAELGGVAAVVAERDQIHAAQHRADHGDADLDDIALTGLQRVERVDARRVGAGDVDVEALLLEEAALQRDGQADLVDTGDHAGFQFHGRLRLRRGQRQQQSANEHQNTSHRRHPPVGSGSTRLTQYGRARLARSARFTPRTSTALSWVPETLP